MSIRDQPFLRQVKHIHPDANDPRTAIARQQIRRDSGMLVPPFALHLPVPDAFNAFWAIYRESTHGRRVARAKKEAVAATVSATNACPYCVDAHAAILHALGDRTLAEAIATGEHDRITDPELRAVVDWAEATRHPYAPILADRPFPEEHAPEMIGMAVSFHYINRMVNIFCSESPFPVTAPRSIGRRAVAQVFRLLLRRDVRPGVSLELLAPAGLPDDLAWARPDPTIAAAFGRAAAVFDAVGERAVPEPIRELVAARLSTWVGQEPRLSGNWIDGAIQTLPESQRPQARLALLAGFASYQVNARVLDEARAGRGAAADGLLVATAAWASFAAARQIGTWLDPAIVKPSLRA